MGIHQIGARAVFLDRDGVLNRNVYNPETGSFESPLRGEDVVLHTNVIPALLRLQDAGYLLIVVSNQPNVAKGKSTMDTLNVIDQLIFGPIEAGGVSFAARHYCFHHPAGVVAGYSGSCDCRKPSPKFLLDDARRFDLNLRSSWMIGDRETDIQCGISAGVRTIRIKGDDPGAADHLQVAPDFEAWDLFEAAAIVLTKTSSRSEHVGHARP